MGQCQGILQRHRISGGEKGNRLGGRQRNSGYAHAAVQGRVPRKTTGEERHSAHTSGGTSRNEMLCALSKTRVPADDRSPSVHARMQLLLQSTYSPVPTCRGGLHAQVNGRIKKREEEGVLVLPLSKHVHRPPIKEVRVQMDEKDKMGGVNRLIRGDAPADPEQARSDTLYPVGQAYNSQRSDPEPPSEGPHSQPAQPGQPNYNYDTDFNALLLDIYTDVTAHGLYNFQGAQRRVPSGLCITAWQKHLANYSDQSLVTFLEYGWPINFNRDAPLTATMVNHASAASFTEDVEYYIETELGHRALAGPFGGPPVVPMQLSPLMTRDKKNAQHRRVIMDLSWPPGFAINDGVDTNWYLDGPGKIKLPTVDFMEARLLDLGKGAYMFKTDLARGYRQLRVDPTDWPLLGFKHRDRVYMDLCPPFGLRTSALFMQRTSEAITYIHGKAGYYTRPYLDDFGGAESSEGRATSALESLQAIMKELGIQEAVHKVCPPAQTMVWLGILFNSIEMTMRIPDEKMAEIKTTLKSWEGKTRATMREIQQLMGLLNFVASVSPPARIFTNRMFEGLREAPRRGTETLSLGFKQDLSFFTTMWPDFNGIKIIDKDNVQCQGDLELDACLTGCGAFTGSHYYSEHFPAGVLSGSHPIAHLELLNVVVAVKTWAEQWRGQRVQIHCDNTNACLAIQSGRSRDSFVQKCIRELFVICTRCDIELRAVHRPGAQLQRADALSRAPTSNIHRLRMEGDSAIQLACRVRIPPERFNLNNDL